MHGLLVGDILAHESLAVDLDNLVACQQSGTLRRSVGDDVLHMDGVLTDGELDAHAEERPLEVVVSLLDVLLGDVDAVGVELLEDGRHGLLDQVAHVDGVDILVVDNVQQVVQLVTARIDNAQPVARETVGKEATDEDT